MLFQIVADLFRDRELTGWLKTLWFLLLAFIPVLTALVYLITRGKGMAIRQEVRAQQAVAGAETYISEVAGASPAQQISEAKELLDSGTITGSEFDALKAKALA
ncbi:PLDc N-terminal domain-containing protein [Paeniglutamicibacter cryotolerans]|uniref:Putative membrane protein n=1 Tax=Paeniglutamicibacter cryotolerans TaxID=670079 RepID=A0A839QKH5_9MICC|nr:PLDc N-terminal domain-containing protein [Paeniglutamicibacter cryotolerans]MBB2996898.1 putative membrane protein [Paeniglutamicibacter cryotolerans]